MPCADARLPVKGPHPVHTHTFLLHIGVALVAALAGGLLARLLRLPVLVGYLLAGVAVGPNTPGIVADPSSMQAVANLGVALLMFAVGAQFSLHELRAVQRTAVLGGGAQIIGTILLGLLVGRVLGWSVYGGLFLGCAIALSSTAVMMRILEERGELGTAHGAVMLGFLVVQDLTVVLMIALLPALSTLVSGQPGALLQVGEALLRAGLFIAAVLLLAARGVPVLLRLIARTGSRELFLLTIVSLCLVAAVSAEWAGLGLPLGAFLAGLIVTETDYSDEVFSQVRPLRDVFASLFFVSVGMLLDPRFLVEHAGAILLVVLAIVLGKGLLTGLAVYALGRHGRTALLTGLGLAQIGEFSFVLASLGSERGLIPPEIAGVILSAALVTLLMAPFLFASAAPLYVRLNAVPALSRVLNRQQAEEPFVFGHACSDARVLILGYGRVGEAVSEALQARNVPHNVVDYDAGAVERAQRRGVPVVYGDASSDVVLAQAAPHCVELALVALPEEATTSMAIRLLKRLAPRVKVLARVHREQDIAGTHATGADAVVQAEFEAGMEMVRQTLDRLDFADAEVDAYIEALREQRYRT